MQNTGNVDYIRCWSKNNYINLKVVLQFFFLFPQNIIMTLSFARYIKTKGYHSFHYSFVNDIFLKIL